MVIEALRNNVWQTGDSYDAYMGRWSRAIACRFIDWLDLPPGLRWLDLGCGTGALSRAILARADPARVIALDPAQSFIERARGLIPDRRVAFRTGDAMAIGLDDDSLDVTVSGLMLNFLPDPARGLREMARVTAPGGTIAFYLWDYPGRGLEFLDAFWRAAAAINPAAAALAETMRFPRCTPEGLAALCGEVGLPAPEIIPLEAPTVFRDFEDFWNPFTLGTGPAPAYCASLDPEARARLADRLRSDLPPGPRGAISLTARAWALRTTAP